MDNELQMECRIYKIKHLFLQYFIEMCKIERSIKCGIQLYFQLHHSFIGIPIGTYESMWNAIISLTLCTSLFETRKDTKK